MAILMSKYEVILDITEPVLGTVPKDKNIYKTYVQKEITAAVAAGAVGANGTKLYQEQLDEEAESITEMEERGWTGFHELDGRPFVFDYYIKGHIKDVANVLKDQLGVRNLRSKVENVVFVQPRRIFFEPQPGLTMVRDVLERPLRAMTMEGPRVTLTRSDTLADVSLRFYVLILKNTEVKRPLVEGLFEYGNLRGLGQWRNGGWGRYQLRSFTPVSEVPDDEEAKPEQPALAPLRRGRPKVEHTSSTSKQGMGN